ncbi:hypothetical protein SAMN04487990_1318 [Bizionia paragorgiae]|uniref:Uncharacterized protein n=1 Tax=Bizionia paragorgiae TaxID=283786 RepID=A0A1H4DFS3_BIZPA|nr:hypothetical protein SAMN04487990_1318 [Bizionia paragorgiae]
MTIIYILLFGTLNLLIFSHLTKKNNIHSGLKIGLICVLGLFGLMHFINPFDNAIPNKLFLILLGFSLALIIFHYGSRIAIWFTIQINNKERDDLLFKWYDILIFYVVYIMIFVFQIATLIKN